MSATVAAVGPAHQQTGPTLLKVMRSEWTKLRSVRATRWTVVAYLAVSLGLGSLIIWGNANDYSRHPVRDFDALGIALGGTVFLAVLAVVVLGAMTITSEYSTGGIRTSLTAVPNRLRFWAAKVIVFSGLALVLGLVGCVGSYLIAQPIYSSYGISTSWSDPGVTRAVLGGAAYVALCGLFGMGLGFVLRNSPGAIASGIGLLLVLPLLSFLLPGTVGHAIARYLTSNAGTQIATINPSGNRLGPWTGFGVFALWAVIPLSLGAFLLKRRDA